jgi:transcriptional regulator with XRE-family HTH domain
MDITVSQLRAACGLLGISQHEIARRAGIGTRTVESLFSRGHMRDVRPDTLNRIMRVFRDLEFRDGGVVRRHRHHAFK